MLSKSISKKLAIQKKAQKDMDIRIKEILEDLKKELMLVFPPHHWNHVNVFAAYWELVERAVGTKSR